MNKIKFSPRFIAPDLVHTQQNSNEITGVALNKIWFNMYLKFSELKYFN